MKRFHLVTAGLAGAGMVLAAAPAASAATAPVTVEQKVLNYADDCGGGSHWATSNFDAKTTITKTGEGKYTLAVADKGSFKAIKGAKSLHDNNVTVSRALTGWFTSTRSYEVTGKLKSEFKLGQLPDYDRKNKQDISSEKCASGWWKQFFVKEQTPQDQNAMKTWRWDYNTVDEKMTDADSGSTGNITGKLSSELRAAGLCRKADGTLRWTVANTRGDRSRDFKYGVHLKNGKWATAKTGTVPAGGKVTVWTAPGTSLAVHYYDGYSVQKKIYAYPSTKSC